MNKQMSTIAGVLIVLFVVGIIGTSIFLFNQEKLEEIEYKELKFNEQGETELCPVFLTYGIALENGIVINSQENYEIFLDELYKSNYENHIYRMEEVSYEEFFETCNIFPKIDFSEYFLLGRSLSGGGCSILFEHDFYKNKEAKKIVYEATIIETGFCDQGVMGSKWALISRDYLDYNVVFRTNRI